MTAPVERFDALSAWTQAGYAARIILVILVAFAVLLFFIVVERWLAYRRAERSAAAPQFRPGRHMHTLAAIKATAPMLGFLATLLGVINALAGTAMTGVLNQQAMAAGMAEALLMAVLGLVVGLPAWWAHSFFSAWGERLTAGVRS